MRLIPPNVSVVDADLDKHPPLCVSVRLSLSGAHPARLGEQLGEILVRSGTIKLLYSPPRISEECAPFVAG